MMVFIGGYIMGMAVTLILAAIVMALFPEGREVAMGRFPLVPILGRVVVEIVSPDEEYAGRILSPYRDALLGEQKWRKGIVVASSDDDVPVGAEVIVPRDNGSVLTWQGREYRVLFGSEVLAAIEKEANGESHDQVLTSQDAPPWTC